MHEINLTIWRNVRFHVYQAQPTHIFIDNVQSHGCGSSKRFGYTTKHSARCTFIFQCLIINSLQSVLVQCRQMSSSSTHALYQIFSSMHVGTVTAKHQCFDFFGFYFNLIDMLKYILSAFSWCRWIAHFSKQSDKSVSQTLIIFMSLAVYHKILRIIYEICASDRTTACTKNLFILS